MMTPALTLGGASAVTHIVDRKRSHACMATIAAYGNMPASEIIRMNHPEIRLASVRFHLAGGGEFERASPRSRRTHTPPALSNAGLIFLSGACRLLKDGAIAGVGDYASSGHGGISKHARSLEEAKAGIEDVISSRVLVASADRSGLVSACDVIGTSFGTADAAKPLYGGNLVR